MTANAASQCEQSLAIKFSWPLSMMSQRCTFCRRWLLIYNCCCKLWHSPRAMERRPARDDRRAAGYLAASTARNAAATGTLPEDGYLAAVAEHLWQWQPLPGAPTTTTTNDDGVDCHRLRIKIATECPPSFSCGLMPATQNSGRGTLATKTRLENEKI